MIIQLKKHEIENPETILGGRRRIIEGYSAEDSNDNSGD